MCLSSLSCLEKQQLLHDKQKLSAEGLYGSSDRSGEESKSQETGGRRGYIFGSLTSFDLRQGRG